MPESARNLYYNKELQPNAHELRNNMTKAEACLWKYVLRAGGMGVPFRRQRPVLEYIADFMCKPLMLIIEVDGDIHNDAEIAAHDLKRQQDLEDIGFTVLRFRNEDVLRNISGVRVAIEDWIKARLDANDETSTQR